MAWQPILTSQQKKQGWQPILSTQQPAKQTFSSTVGQKPTNPLLSSLSPQTNVFGATKSSTPQTAQMGTVDVLKAVGQGVMTGFGATGAALKGLPEQARALVTDTPVKQGSQSFTPTGKFQQALYGTDQPISLETGGEIPGLIEKNQPFKPFGVEVQGLSNPAVVGAAFGILDLAGAGGVRGLKGLSTALKGAKETGETFQLMKQAGFADDIAERYADIFAKEKDIEKIEQGLLSAEKLQNTTKATAKAPAESFEGFTDLSTKLLEKLKGRTTVSRQFIEDLSNSPDLKQPERDLIRNVLKDETDTVTVPDFANKVKSELLPLEAHTSGSSVKPNRTSADYRMTPRYENISLPPELRGNVADYRERIYNSPIETSAGGVHFGSAKNDITGKGYFAHSRIEDLPKNTGTRRVIELQSDLFQKGRLEAEKGRGIGINSTDPQMVEYQRLTDEISDLLDTMPNNAERRAKQLALEAKQKALYDEARAPRVDARSQELSKLEPYRNTWHERIIREEIKQAAKDGKTKLQFPTGETIAKIEGWDNATTFKPIRFTRDGYEELGRPITQDDLKLGSAVLGDTGRPQFITKVREDGTFRSVDELTAENTEPIYRFAQKNKLVDEYGSLNVREALQKATGRTKIEFINLMDEYAEGRSISGKTDFESLSPEHQAVYKFYEKEVGKYLKNKYGAQLITDPQGVKWWEVDLKGKGFDKAPIEAFGVGAGIQVDEEGNVSFDPTSAALGVAGVAGASRLRGKLEEFNRLRGGTGDPAILEAFQKAESEVFTQLELSEAGSRNFIGYGSDLQVQGISSTFPKWVPEHLREKKLFEKVSELYFNGQTPRANATREIEMLDILKARIVDSIPEELRDEAALRAMFEPESTGPKGPLALPPPSERKLVGEVETRVQGNGFTMFGSEPTTGKKVAKTRLQDELDAAHDGDLISTRRIKQTPEYQSWAKYAEENFKRDITSPLLGRHMALTAERVAEYLDGGVIGRTYKEMVKPVYDAEKKIKVEGNKIAAEIKAFKVLEGSEDDLKASLYAQGKIDDPMAVPENARKLAVQARYQYDEFLERLNDVRKKIGIEPIPKREDYITHLNEMNVLTELFGGVDRITVNNLIRSRTDEILETNPTITRTIARERAKKEVEGLTGIERYISARQPTFRFAKERLGEFEKNPSIIRSLNAYTEPALRYIYQAENVAKNKAYKDQLPANAKAFFDKWNTEQVAGHPPKSILREDVKRGVVALRNTLGSNTILGNMSTTLLQLTSHPQVIAMLGPRRWFEGVGTRLASYLNKEKGLYQYSRAKALRELETDMGFGNSLIDEGIRLVGQYTGARNATARARAGIDFGRHLLTGLMKSFDGFTTGATFEAAYRYGTKDLRLPPETAMEFAEIMTGKLQANYYKSAIPPFLNTVGGRMLGQFGTYGINQFEMFLKDFGKNFGDLKSEKNLRTAFATWTTFLVGAYIVDAMSEKTFGRQPYDIKSLVDESVGFATGDSTVAEVRDQAGDTALGYIPYLSSAKFDTMPPVFEFGNDVRKAIFSEGTERDKAINDLGGKWIYSVLLPYAGNQVSKTLQGVEAVAGIDIPFIKDATDGGSRFTIEEKLEQAKAFLFGPWSTKGAREFFEREDRISALKDKYKITGSPTSKENLDKFEKMTAKEFADVTSDYTISTLKTIKAKQTFFKIQEIRVKDEEAAQKAVEAMTDEEYKAYLAARQGWRSSNTSKVRELLAANPEEAVVFAKSLPKDERTRIANLLTDEQYELYRQAKERVGLTTTKESGE